MEKIMLTSITYAGSICNIYIYAAWRHQHRGKQGKNKAWTQIS